jgi:hypothetical protein
VGASGAVIMIPDATFAPEQNHFFAPWIEFLHVPTNGTVFHLAGSRAVIDHPQFFDCGKESGATGTSYIRIAVASAGLSGGNEILGDIPGTDGGATTIDTGIRMYQSRNKVFGIKGYRGTNVTLEAGCGFTFMFLGGEISSATDVAYVDNSGQTTNLGIDCSQGIFDIVVGKKINILDADTRLGTTSGPRFLVSGGQVYADNNTWNFRSAAGANGLQIDSSSGVVSHFVHTFNVRTIEKVVTSTVASNSAITLASQSGNIFAVTLNANVTGTTISNAATGQKLTIEFIQDATGGRTYVWPTNCRFAGGSAPSTTTASTRTSVTFYFDGTNWYELARAVAVPT